MGLAALRPWMPEGPRPEPARLDPITLLPNRRQYSADAMLWGAGKASLVLVTLCDAHTFSEILRVFGHARSEAFLRAGAERLRDILGPGTRGLPRQPAELRLPPARPHRAGRAADGRPHRRRLPRADPLRRRADRHPHRHRAQGTRHRRRQSRRGPARGARRRRGQPDAPQGLGLVRPAARRRAPPRLPPALRPEVGARDRGPAGAALPAEGRPRFRELRQRRGAAALDPSRVRARSRPASSWRSPRRRRSSPR